MNIIANGDPISKDELITLYKTGRLETDGITVIYGD